MSGRLEVCDRSAKKGRTLRGLYCIVKPDLERQPLTRLDEARPKERMCTAGILYHL
jgi:hypothetical protein